jgi:hypothetical protein
MRTLSSGSAAAIASNDGDANDQNVSADRRASETVSVRVFNVDPIDDRYAAQDRQGRPEILVVPQPLSQRPLSRAYYPFIGPIFKARSGSIPTPRRCSSKPVTSAALAPSQAGKMERRSGLLQASDTRSRSLNWIACAEVRSLPRMARATSARAATFAGTHDGVRLRMLSQNLRTF